MDLSSKDLNIDEQKKSGTRTSLVQMLITKCFLCYTAIIACAIIFQFFYEISSEEEKLIHKITNAQQSRIESLALLMIAGEDQKIRLIMSDILSSADIIGLSVRDPSDHSQVYSLGVVEAATGELTEILPDGSHRNVQHDVTMIRYPLTDPKHPDQNPSGYFRLYADKSVVFDEVQKKIKILVIHSVLSLIVFWLLFLVVSKRLLSVPLRQITSFVTALRKDMSISPETLVSKNHHLTERRDEIGFLARAIVMLMDYLKDNHQQMMTCKEGFETKLKEKMEFIQKLQEQLIAAEKQASLSHLVAGLAHEINTPVSIGLTSMTEIMSRNKNLLSSFHDKTMTKTDLQQFLSMLDEIGMIIVENLNRTAALISSFKEVSSDQASSVSRVFQIKVYLERILQSLKPELKKYDPGITIHCSDHIIMDSFPGPFSQVVTNLIMNALIHGYNSTPGGKIDIFVSEAESKDHILLAIRDYGVGIKPHDLKKIFDPFYTTRRGSGGTGLGLSIVYNIVERNLGGSVSCQSEPGSFTEFLVDIPKVFRQDIDRKKAV